LFFVITRELSKGNKVINPMTIIKNGEKDKKKSKGQMFGKCINWPVFLSLSFFFSFFLLLYRMPINDTTAAAANV
jgi:hypothetical protein